MEIFTDGSKDPVSGKTGFGMYVANLQARPDLLLEILCCLFRIEHMGCHVGFLWVPGHSRVEGNEISDKLAKESLLRETTDQKVQLGKSEYFSFQN